MAERLEEIAGHHVGNNMALDVLEVPPTREELTRLLEALNAQSVSAFDVKAQAIVMIVRLQTCLQNAEKKNA